MTSPALLDNFEIPLNNVNNGDYNKEMNDRKAINSF